MKMLVVCLTSITLGTALSQPAQSRPNSPTDGPDSLWQEVPIADASASLRHQDRPGLKILRESSGRPVLATDENKPLADEPADTKEWFARDHKSTETPDSPLEHKGPIENIDDISPSAPSEEQQRPVSGVIRYEETHPDNLKSTLTIFDALDEALVRGPRGAAIRALLPVATSTYARATQQTSASFNYDNGVWAEQTRRMGTATVFEGPWNVILRLLVAKYTVQQQKVDCLTQLWQLRGDVRTAYTEVVVAQETLETLNDLWDLAHRLRIVSEKRFQAGDVPELDVLKSRTAESQADIDRGVAYRRVVRAKQQLNVIIGRSAEHTLIVPRLPSFLTLKTRKDLNPRNPLMPEFGKPVPAMEHYMVLAMQHRYEIKSLERQIAVARTQFKYTVGTIIPNIPFWYGASRAGNLPTGPKTNAFYVGFNIPSQVSDFNQGDLSLYKAAVRQLRYQLGAQKNQVQSDVSSAYNDLLAARQKMRSYEVHILADSQEVARLARRSYEVGQSDITSTIQAMQNNVQVRLSYLDAITKYTGALTNLERACGTPLLSADDWD